MRLRVLIVIVLALSCAGCLGHRIAARRDASAPPSTGLTEATATRLGIPSSGTVLALPGACLRDDAVLAADPEILNDTIDVDFSCRVLEETGHISRLAEAEVFRRQAD